MMQLEEWRLCVFRGVGDESLCVLRDGDIMSYKIYMYVYIYVYLYLQI